MSDYLRADFEATLDEVVDVYLRQVRRNPSLRRQFRRTAIIIGVMCGMFAIVAIDSVLRRPVGADILLGFVVGAVVGAMSMVFHEQSLTKRTRTVVAEHFGTRSSIRCEIELRPTGLWVQQDQMQLLLDWETAKSVDDTPDGIELWFRWGLVVARNRGFATPADRERFLAAARARVPVSRQSF